MSTPTNIANMALGHLGIGKDIANLTNEQSSEAAACRRFYDIALTYVLRAWHWPFAKKYAQLALVENNPTVVWAYSYRYPADCVDVHSVGNGSTYNVSSTTKTVYEIGSDESGKLIYVGQYFPEIEYTRLVRETSFYPPDFMLALSAYLAHLIAPRLTSIDSGMSKQALELYRFNLAEAKASAYNEESRPMKPEAESIRARDGGDYDIHSGLDDRGIY